MKAETKGKIPYAKITFLEQTLANFSTLCGPIKATNAFIKTSSNRTLGTIPPTQLTKTFAPSSNKPVKPEAILTI